MTSAINPSRNRFQFATVASQRAKQLQIGCTPKVDGSAKIARRAQQEVAKGLIQEIRPADIAEREE